MNTTDVARVCHEAHRAYCISLGDLSNGPWDLLPDAAKAAVVAGVKAALADFSLTPAQCHSAWMNDKLAKGWKLGPMKAPDRLEHPCLVEFDKLPLEHQTKDVLFLGIVRVLASLIAEIGLPPPRRVETPESVDPDFVTSESPLEDSPKAKKKRGH